MCLGLGLGYCHWSGTLSVRFFFSDQEYFRWGGSGVGGGSYLFLWHLVNYYPIIDPNSGLLVAYSARSLMIQDLDIDSENSSGSRKRTSPGKHARLNG
jgi:hypothetical protein